MNKDREVRTTSSEIRVINGDGSAKSIAGHAAIFDSMSQNLGDFREIIQKGAFLKSLSSSDVRALWNHDSNIVLGRNKSGTLRLHEDDSGLAFAVDMPDTQLVRDMVTSPIERGDVSQCSFGFSVPKGGDKWQKTENGWVRTLVNVDIFDVSPCTYPAYLGTDIAVRSMNEAIKLEIPDTLYMIDLMRRKLNLAI